jgi:hypothetical protein
MKLIGLKVRQHRIQQQHTVIRTVVLEQLERPGATSRLDYIPAWETEFVTKSLTNFWIWAYNEDIDWKSIFITSELSNRNAHGISFCLLVRKQMKHQ